MTSPHLTRQFDLIPLDVLGTTITIVGAGAVGGWTALSLVKMGFSNITVWDDDVIEIENMNSQLYRHKDIGKKKVDALKDIINDFCDIEITVKDTLYPLTNHLNTSNLFLSCVDSMDSRKVIWDTQKKNGFCKHYIDPRMGAETALLYVMNPNDDKDIDSYEKSLYSDSGAVQEKCTAKSTQYCALALSGLICAQVKNLVTNNKYSRITHWDIPKGGYVRWENET